jgi:sugar (pentulose or hexulose) kinase
MIKSGLWLQIMADVFGLPVHISGASEASAFGAVILGADALNIPCNFENRIIQTFYPTEANLIPTSDLLINLKDCMRSSKMK